MSFQKRYHYRFESNRDETRTVFEVILTPKGWEENEEKIMTKEEAGALRSTLKDLGYIVSHPPSYGGTNVLEFWDAPR